jgi:hypothetical protein
VCYISLLIHGDATFRVRESCDVDRNKGERDLVESLFVANHDESSGSDGVGAAAQIERSCPEIFQD